MIQEAVIAITLNAVLNQNTQFCRIKRCGGAWWCGVAPPPPHSTIFNKANEL